MNRRSSRTSGRATKRTICIRRYKNGRVYFHIKRMNRQSFSAPWFITDPTGANLTPVHPLVWHPDELDGSPIRFSPLYPSPVQQSTAPVSTDKTSTEPYIIGFLEELETDFKF